jgi:hypothetical protein
MSQSDPDRAAKVSELASELAGTFAEAIEENRLDTIPDDALGQLFASVVRLYAAKAQEGEPPPPFARNVGVTATDVMIGCTAMLEAVNSLVFELGLWQSWTNIGKRKRVDHDTEVTR